jgi:hypothetical protein
VFEQEILSRLQNQRFDTQLGAWLVLMHLEAQGSEWASHKLSRDWPASASQQLELFGHQDTPLNPHTVTRLERFVSTSSLEVADKVGHNLSWLGAVEGTGEIFAWVSRFYEPDSDPGERRFHLSFQEEPQQVFMTLQEVSSSEQCPGILELDPSRLPRWTLLRAAAQLAMSPSPETLAAALRTLSKDWDEPSIRAWKKRVPWPLGVCLEHCTSPADALALANHAEKGELGTEEDWFKAEERWERLGVHLDDLTASAGEVLPLSPEIARRGFPLEMAYWSVRSDFSEVLITPLVRLALTLPDPKGKVLARLVVWLLADSGGELDFLDPSQFRQLTERVDKLDFGAINSLRWSRETKSDAIEAVRASSGKFVKERYSSKRLSPQKQLALRQAFTAAPEQVELLVPIALDMLMDPVGWEPLTTKVDAECVDRTDQSRVRAAALLLWLRQGLTITELDAFADRAAGLSDALLGFIGNLGRLTEAMKVVTADDEQLFLALYKRMQQTSAVSELLSILQARLSHLKSHLDDERTWRRLELPLGSS